MGLESCNPAKEPITRNIIKSLQESLDNGEHCSPEEHALAWLALGDAQWVCQTTHITIATAVSLYSTYMSKKPAGILGAMKHLWRYLSSIKNHCLIKKRGNNEGLRVWCDGDWAGGPWQVNKPQLRL